MAPPAGRGRGEVLLASLLAGVLLMGAECDGAPAADGAGLAVPEASRLEFGAHYLGRSETRVFRVHNVGESAFEITTVLVDANPAFTVDAALPLTVPPRGDASFVVAFTPLSADVVGGELWMATTAPNLPEHRVTLLGEGVALPACQDPGPCLIAVFDSQLEACRVTPELDGQVCDDGNACTGDDRCSDGICVGEDISARCSDEDPCTLDLCDSVESCQHTPDPAACDDGDPCTLDLCDAVQGCRHIWTADGTPCGVAEPGCEGTPVCQEGSCVAMPLADGASCDDGQPCTVDDRCSGGLCVGDVPAGAPSLGPVVPLLGTGNIVRVAGDRIVQHGATRVTTWIQGPEGWQLVFERAEPDLGAPVAGPFLLEGGQVALVGSAGLAVLDASGGALSQVAPVEPGLVWAAAAGRLFAARPGGPSLLEAAADVDPPGLSTLSIAAGADATSVRLDGSAGRLALLELSSTQTRLSVLTVTTSGAPALLWTRVDPPLSCAPALLLSGDEVICLEAAPEGGTVLSLGATGPALAHPAGPWAPPLLARVGGGFAAVHTGAERVDVLTVTAEDVVPVANGPELRSSFWEARGPSQVAARSGARLLFGDSEVDAPTELGPWPASGSLTAGGDAVVLHDEHRWVELGLAGGAPQVVASLTFPRDGGDDLRPLLLVEQPGTGWQRRDQSGAALGPLAEVRLVRAVGGVLERRVVTGVPPGLADLLAAGDHLGRRTGVALYVGSAALAFSSGLWPSTDPSPLGLPSISTGVPSGRAGQALAPGTGYLVELWEVTAAAFGHHLRVYDPATATPVLQQNLAHPGGPGGGRASLLLSGDHAAILLGPPADPYFAVWDLAGAGLPLIGAVRLDVEAALGAPAEEVRLLATAADRVWAAVSGGGHHLVVVATVLPSSLLNPADPDAAVELPGPVRSAARGAEGLYVLGADWIGHIAPGCQ